MKVRFALSVGLGPPDPAALAAVVAGAEARGFDGLWFSDVPLLPTTDPLLAVAFAAARSQRLKLGVNVVPYGRTPFVLARELAQLDHLSGGRLLVTLVPGLDQPGERAALGIDGADRGQVLDDTIVTLRRWWTGERIGEAALPVTPVQQPLELWLGGKGPKAIRRAGRLSDGWLGALMAPDEAGVLRQAIEAEARAAGRVVDPEHFGMSIAYARGQGVDVPPIVPVGAGGLRALVGQLVDQGLSKFVVRTTGPVTSWDDELDWLAETLLDLQT
jgi:probable F420-dependent oxidoreductase